MQTTKPVREFVFLGLALGTTGFTLLPFVLFRAEAFLPVGVGIHAGTFKSIYTASLAITLIAALGALICSAMRRDIWSALVSFAPVAVLILFAYSLFGLALFDIR
jgi:hypothetical protein